MMNIRTAFTILPLLFLLPLVSASCPFLDVSTINMANVTQGAMAAYPITLLNKGLQPQVIQLSGTCPTGFDCSFQPSSYAVLSPSETKAFTLVVIPSAPGNYSVPVDIEAAGSVCELFNYTLLVQPSNINQSIPAFSVTVSPEANQSARPDEELLFKVAITNNRDEKGYGRIKIMSPFKDAATLDLVDVDLLPKQSKTIAAKVAVPAGTPRGTYDIFFITNTYEGSGCCEYSDVARRQVYVFADKLALTLQGEPLSCLLTKHGEKTTYTFKLRNDGETSGPFDFELLGDQKALSAASIDTSTLEIKPGDTQELKWTIQPLPSMVLDRYPVTLRAKRLAFTIFEKPLCFVVDAQRNFTVSANETYYVTRGEPAVITFRVKNTGTTKAVYTIAANPPKGFDFRLTEPSFTLLAGESKQAELLVGTTMQAALGEQKLDVVVSDGRVRNSVNAYASVSSSTRPDKSYLSISTKPISVYAGVPQENKVGVTNKYAKTLGNVSISVEGIPAGWYDIQTPSRNILASKTAYYSIYFVVPLENASQRKVFSVFAQSQEGEKVRDYILLDAKQPPAHLDVAVTSVQRDGDNIAFTVIVYNNGLKPLDGIAVTAGNGSQLVQELAPGEQKVLVFQALAAAPIAVQATSIDGVKSRIVTVPLESNQRFNVSGLMVALLVLMLLLVAIAFYLRREGLERFVESSKA